MNSDQLISQILSAPDNAQCIFHSPDFVSVHKDDHTLRIYKRTNGQWELFKLCQIAKIKEDHERHMCELGDRIARVASEPYVQEIIREYPNPTSE